VLLAINLNAQTSDGGSKAFEAWARSSARPIATTEPGADLRDLEPIREVVGVARVVGVGESDHGIHEFLNLRQRIVEFLVQRMGFTAVALESGLPESKIVYDYVEGGAEPPHLWDDGFTWQMSMFSDNRTLIEWMRAYNQDPAHKRKIHFYGMDIPGAKGTWLPALGQVLTYLDKVEPKFAREMRERLLPLAVKFARLGPTNLAFNASNDAYSELSLSDRNAIAAGINELSDRFGLLRVAYLAASTPEEYDWARQIALNLRYANTLVTDYEARNRENAIWNARDMAMAENVRWIEGREGPGGGVVVLAHNGHVQTITSIAVDPKQAVMGEFLRSLLGDDYRNIGFTFNQGAQWDGSGYDLHPSPLALADADSIDGVLAKVALPIFFVNLRALPHQSPASEWLEKPRKQRFVTIYPEYDLLRSWDALVFVDTITPSRLIKPEPTP
jgi:erythromycin esterase